ncbi:GNAT family N-acetyltransferase [Candidatus Thiodiazotropha sp. CDECU1]|uniref:GNAT family N-acetyltransferase n=1 Tax=Candidatus Thiodiazotropha sp. CDECU1 TaxID=3065865 RepID=UPI00293072E8|nr:GNAT family N-acetyltransferase [Candidatus Thiodiazotropha sp. CDECU1]
MNIRSATADDGPFIAQMIELSSDGVASLEWQEASERQEDVTPLDFGSQLYSSSEGDYSYRNCRIAEIDGPVGMLLSFPLTEENMCVDAMPPPFEPGDYLAPFKYLEAKDSWYICGVAVRPEYRKFGIATQLMKQSMAQGKVNGYDNCSLVAMCEKQWLIEFYESLGFRVTKTAPIVEHPGIRVSGLAALMERQTS